MNATKTNDQLAAELQEQIRRFGLHDTPSNCYGLVAYTGGDDQYPAGTIRLAGDGGEGTLVDALATLEKLRAHQPCGEFEADQEAFYGCVVTA